MCRLSIVIPFLSDIEHFEDTLVSVLQNRPDDCEVLVVHRGKYDDPYNLDDEVRFVVASGDAPFAEVVNAGFERAHGEFFHLLQVGCRATVGWTEPALAHFADLRVGAVAPLVLEGGDTTRIASAGLRRTMSGMFRLNAAGMSVERRGVFRRAIIGPSAGAAFYRRALVDAMGGYCPRLGSHYAAADFALSLKELGYGSVLEPASVLIADVAEQGNASAYAAGREAEQVYWRHVGTRPRLVSLAGHSLTVLAEFLAGIGRPGTCATLLGRSVGFLQAGRQRRRPPERRFAPRCWPDAQERSGERAQPAWRDAVARSAHQHRAA